jgi:hypothetical protein
MRLSELSGTLIISIRERERNSIPIIKTKIEAQLNALKARTIITENVITFKTINIILATRRFDTNIILLRIYKEGQIVIDKEGKKLKICWAVKLDTLYIVALFSSIMAGLTASLYASVNLVSSVSFGIVFFLVFIFLGILLIKYKLTELIETSVYRK